MMATSTTTDLPETSSSPYRIRVALAVHLFDTFDYEVTAAQFQQIKIGTRVLVSFRNKHLIGIVMEKIDAAIPFLQSFQLKPIVQYFDEPVLLDSHLLQLLQWAAQYYQSPIGEVVLSALPNLLRQGKPYDVLSFVWRICNHPEKNVKITEKQTQALQTLKLHPHGAGEAILNMSGISNATLNQLAKKQLIEKHVQATDWQPEPMQLAQMPLTANAEQAEAITQIRQSLGQYRAFLLDGITGSGKTEVYLQVMQTVLQQGKQVLVLVPEIGLTPQTVERFKARFHTHIALLHSSLSDHQRMQAWQATHIGKAGIVLGTRLAVFCPLPKLGLIVIDEEHDLSFKQQDTFRYHARDVAIYRAAKQHCPIILGSATPSFESLALAQQQKLHHLHLTQRAGNAKPPKFQLIDLRGQKKQHGLAESLIQAIGQRIQQKQQVLLFINRRGYAPVLMCSQCGWQADCPYCDAHLTVHYHPIMQLQCHHCGYQQRLPQVCPSCQSEEVIPIGQGTARIEETLQTLFPETAIIRVDRDTTAHIDSWQKIYQRAQLPEACIFLGTQMLAKGHHFPYVSLVVILDVDAGLMSADFRAPERTAQLVMQVAGRAGRGQTGGLVLLQSLRPDHPLLQCLVQHGYGEFARQSLQERQIAQLPPYRYAALLRAESQNDQYNMEILQQAQQAWHHFGDTTVEFWGPIHAPMQKKAGFYRTHLLILCPSRALLQQHLQPWWQCLWRQSRKHRLRLSIDIDPQELG